MTTKNTNNYMTNVIQSFDEFVENMLYMNSLLMDNCKNLNFKNGENKTLMQLAIEKRLTGVVKQLLKNGVNCNIKDSNGLYLLHSAVSLSENEDDEILHMLINDPSTDLYVLDNHSNTIMYNVIIENEYPKIVKLLLHHKYDTTTVSEYLGHPLYMALKHTTNVEIINMLIDSGADVNLVFTCYTPIEALYAFVRLPKDDTCCDHDCHDTDAYDNSEIRSDMVIKLLKCGAEMYVQRDMMPLMHNAIFHNDIKVIEYLIKCKYNIELKDYNENSYGSGQTPLHYAAGKQSLSIVNLLIKSGANVNTTDEDGNTPLHSADVNVSIIVKLLEAGADLNVKNNEGKYPLRQAMNAKDAELISALKKKYNSNH